MANTSRLIVMTGGTSGFGRFTARQLLSEGNELLLAVHRSPAPPGASALKVDMRSLQSVRGFASEVRDMIGDRRIDALVLNAGGGFPDDRSADGFELNFAVNHLAHYLMLRLLEPNLAEGALVVLTTSATHDPAEKTMIAPPVHADASRLAHPQNDPQRDPSARSAAGRAYSASKLCNLLTARAFAAQPETRARSIRVLAFSPGPVPGTGLVRDRGIALDFVWRRIGPALRFVMPKLNRPEDAGLALADLVLGRCAPPAGDVYALFDHEKLTFPLPSELARNDDVMFRLWEDSARLVGLRG